MEHRRAKKASNSKLFRHEMDSVIPFNSLRGQIEHLPMPAADSYDPDLGGHLDAFLEGCSAITALERIDLTSVESANQALEAINRTKENLDQQLRAARALRRLFEQNSR